MGSWQEKLRHFEEMQRTEEQAVVNPQADINQQQEQLRLHKEKELKDVFERQERKRKLIFFEILNTLQVRQELDEIKHQVWQDQGVVVEEKNESNTFARLAFEYNATIQEVEKKEWAEVVGKDSEHVEFSGWHTYDITQERKEKRVVNEYKVRIPSYLEVGLTYKDTGMLLYMLDTEVDLDTKGDVFNKIKADAGGRTSDTFREIKYLDAKGNMFNKRPHSNKQSGWLSDQIIGHERRFSYSLVSSHPAHVIAVVLPSEPNMKAIGDFIDHGLALSCSLRKSQNKLPSQLK